MIFKLYNLKYKIKAILSNSIHLS